MASSSCLDYIQLSSAVRKNKGDCQGMPVKDRKISSGESDPLLWYKSTGRLMKNGVKEYIPK